eukprot:m.42303 g.42303  ORF g.42303 m.42303 type:complete len:50 (+) comp7049_c1_seq1:1632-1781(+)
MCFADAEVPFFVEAEVFKFERAALANVCVKSYIFIWGEGGEGAEIYKLK